jgi:hypothetical protein
MDDDCDAGTSVLSAIPAAFGEDSAIHLQRLNYEIAMDFVKFERVFR